MLWSLSAVVSFAAALTISDIGTNESSPILNGIVFEDISHSGDGGIYGELLANRAFQGDNPSTKNFTGVNAEISLSKDALSDALPYSLQVNGEGFYNEGYWGIKVAAVEYTARFYYKGSSTLIVALKSLHGSETFAEATPQAVTTDNGVYIARSNGFQLFEAKLKPEKDIDGLDNGLFVYGSGNFALVSLFGPTYKDRPNGLRKDIAEVMADFGPHFLRFPGANNLEGEGGPETRWKWNETIGPLIDRPGREGDWGYSNTDGLGLHEYFDWIEDMNLTTILGVWAGYTLKPFPVPEDELQPYIEDTLNELEYILGDVSTKYGALRAKNGREQPWNLQYVEIGNEDFLDYSLSYSYRFAAFDRAIKEKYPDITTIATTEVGISHFPNGTWWDQHYYETPQWFVDHFDAYDNYPRNATKLFIGEYAVVFEDGHSNEWGVSGSRVRFPTVYGAASEAAYMAGLERNSDQVRAACYAPVLENVNGYQWRPNLILFDAGNVNVTPSYQVQKLWSQSQGDQILTLINANFGPLYFVANVANNDTLHVKISNPSNSTTDFVAKVDVTGFGYGIASAEGISSSDPNTTAVDILPWEVKFENQTLSVGLGPYAAGVVTIKKSIEIPSTTKTSYAQLGALASALAVVMFLLFDYAL